MNHSYSPSRIEAFNGCKLKYKYHYIDGLTSDLETIERFMGSIVHEVLENFYELVKGKRIESLDWVLNRYKELWDKNYTTDIKIVKKELKGEDYFNKGKQCLADYFNKYKPFNQAKTVDTEQLINFDIEFDGAKYPFCGKLDRLDWNDKDDIFEIHDYKTSNRLITQEEADSDWQLGLYHAALEQKWPNDIERVKLVWHFLLFNKEIISFRKKDQIVGLHKVVAGKVQEIESCKDFPPRKSALCDWCDFQNICPLWKHPQEMEKLAVNEYKKDPGVKLVVAYKKLEEEKNEHREEIERIEAEQAKIEEAAIEFAERERVAIIDGPDARLKVDITEELRAPTKREDPQMWAGLREFLKKEGKYEEVSTVNNNMLNYKIRGYGWPPELIKNIEKFLMRQITKTVRLIKK